MGFMRCLQEKNWGSVGRSTDRCKKRRADKKGGEGEQTTGRNIAKTRVIFFFRQGGDVQTVIGARRGMSAE